MRRLGLLTLGWVAVALGGVGIVVPGLPTTGFFVLAAACFARSSPRFERWVLGLPKIGPMVRDHRAGLGMPRRAKVVAIAMMLTACSLSSLALGSPLLAAVVMGAGLVGTWYVGWRIPTRERMVPAGPPAGADSVAEAAAVTGDEAQPIA
ncbi:MAG TPA: YbaN family protein [Acidimicrobiales bacterium]|nr:YbaN family protein [Acidimicrobiales bacterium]